MRDSYLEDYFTFLRFPSVSTDAAYKEKLAECAHWLVEKLNGIGLETIRGCGTATPASANTPTRMDDRSPKPASLPGDRPVSVRWPTLAAVTRDRQTRVRGLGDADAGSQADALRPRRPPDLPAARRPGDARLRTLRPADGRTRYLTITNFFAALTRRMLTGTEVR